MTLVECFDSNPIKNILGCLRFNPERLIIIGKEEHIKNPLITHKKILENRGLTPEIIVYDVDLGDYTDVLNTLTHIVNTELQCIIDVNGGRETIFMAVGVLLGNLTESQKKRVSVQGYNQHKETDIDFDGGRTFTGSRVSLTASEIIALYGGTIHPTNEHQFEEYDVDDIEYLWKIVCQDQNKWNKAISALNEFECRSVSETEVYIPLDTVAHEITGYKEKEALVFDLLTKLENNALIRNRSFGNMLRYDYVDPFYHYCTRKAGNILELKTLFEARKVTENGKAYFDDFYMSISIDWDGIIHPSVEMITETRNEIDLFLVHGLTPIFISCKNGVIGEVELYKLNTVASRFGGTNAKKVLVLTSESYLSEGLARRAKDMDIYIVKNAAELTAEGWQRAFKKMVKG